MYIGSTCKRTFLFTRITSGTLGTIITRETIYLYRMENNGSKENQENLVDVGMCHVNTTCSITFYTL